MLFTKEEYAKKYPYMDQYTSFLKKMERNLVGREKELNELQAGMARPELCNILLLAAAGSGKTALVQGCMAKDPARTYLEVNLPGMIAKISHPNEMAEKLKQLFKEVEQFRRDEKKEIVLFIDEFHQIVQLSAAAVEVLKPLLADSGTRGIRVIAATTYIEFQQYIANNQPLVERLQRINVQEPDEEVVVEILRDMAKRYSVETKVKGGDSLYHTIYEQTNRYVPANAQPRKSILIFDAMIGWHRITGRPLDAKLLAEVIYNSEGVNTAFRVDPMSIKKRLDETVLSQDFATSAIENRLQICVADLNNKERPMSSFLFTGSTGTGKGLINDPVIPVYTPDGSVYEKLNGELQVGDYVFNRMGKPVKVVAVYPRGEQDIYKVSLSDGRMLYTDSSHLWTYLLSKGKATMNTYTNSTKELYERGVYIESKDGRRKLKYFIPMNHAVEYPEANLSVHPYVMGAFIGDGCMTNKQLTLSSGDADLVAHVAELLGDCSYKTYHNREFNWVFPINDSSVVKCKRLNKVFGDYPEVCGKTASQKRIPKAFMYSSIEQRWQLIKGLFDTDGTIGNQRGGRYNVSYSSTSYELMCDIQKVLYSLGVASSITISRNIEEHSSKGNYTQYHLSVKSSNTNKDRFFWLPRKVKIANEAKEFGSKQTLAKRKDYDWVGITNIELMPYRKETTCIYVDDEEHLYQAGQYVVTHNTATAKKLAEILFDNNRSLIRFDMTEYALEETMTHFREELAQAIWTKPYSVVLLDEIEKACGSVTRLLLQILDDGRLVDRHDREVSFKNCYIIVTTNAGSEIYDIISQYEPDDAGSGKMLAKYESLIRDSITNTSGGNRFPPELLGRIDCLVPFQPLSEKTQSEICKKKLRELRAKVLSKHHIDLRYDNRLIVYIVKDRMNTEADKGGARNIVNVIEREVTAAVAKFINNHPDYTGSISVSIEGEMAAENKTQLTSTAKIKIVETK